MKMINLDQRQVFLAFALLAINLAIATPGLAQPCTHLGNDVQCPEGVAPGTNSSSFDGPNIIWGDGTRTPVIECCDPFVPPAPEPEPEIIPTPEPEPVSTPEPTPSPESDPMPEATSSPQVPSTPETPEAPSIPSAPGATPTPKPTPGGTPGTGKENIELKGPLDTEKDEETDKFLREIEERRARRKAEVEKLEKGLKNVSEGLSELNNDLKDLVDKIESAPPRRKRSFYRQEEGEHYCGPDVTIPFLNALRRIRFRVDHLPATEGGMIGGNLFMLRGDSQAQNMDYWSSLPDKETKRHHDWKGTAICPSSSCFNSSNGCYTFLGGCFPRHVFSDILYGFIADRLFLPEFNAKAGGAFAQFLKKGPLQALGAAALSFYEDMGPVWVKDAEDGGPKEAAASISAYKFGDELSEDMDFNLNIKPDEINKSDIENLKEGVYRTWPMFKKCKPCPDPTPLYSFKDFSDDPWLLMGDKVQHLKIDPKGRYTVEIKPK